MNREIPFRADFPPRNDVVFSIMFGEKELFAEMLKATTGHELHTDEVFSQAVVEPIAIQQKSSGLDISGKM